VRLFRRTGFATVGPEDHDTIQLLRRTAEVDGLDLDVLRGQEAADRLPEHPLRDGEVALVDPYGGTIRPEASVVTAAALAERSGAVLHRYRRVQDVRRDGDRCIVVADGEEHEFDQVIVAPGPWTPDLDCLSGLPVHVKRICAAWFPRTDCDLFDPSTRPAVIRVGTPAYSCFPAFDDVGVKVIHHVDFQTVGTGEVARPSPEEIQATSEAVRQTLPGLRPTPIRTEVYRDSWTPDGHAILGRLDDGPILVATGFSGHGFKLAPAFGSVLADLVQGLDVDATVASLSPARFIDSRRRQ
jgi:sarcosine oxidase